MASLIPRLIMIGLAASISPVAIVALISVMLRKHPRKNALFFLLGFTITLVAIGIVGLAVFGASTGHRTGHIGSYIDLGLGVLCLCLLPLPFRKRKPRSDDEPADLKASRAVFLGFVFMLVNSSTMVIYIAGTHMISEAKLPVADDILAMVILTAVTLITLLIPIAIEFIFPKAAEKALTATRGWLALHSKWIGAGILLIFGVYLVVKGIVALV